jgi:hypothetical protein
MQRAKIQYTAKIEFLGGLAAWREMGVFGVASITLSFLSLKRYFQYEQFRKRNYLD